MALRLDDRVAEAEAVEQRGGGADAGAVQRRVDEFNLVARGLDHVRLEHDGGDGVLVGLVGRLIERLRRALPFHALQQRCYHTLVLRHLGEMLGDA